MQALSGPAAQVAVLALVVTVSEADWPGWTQESWTHYWADKWPPFLIGTGGVETREEFIENAWNHPLGPEGLQSSFHLAIESLVNEDKVAAAQRWSARVQEQTGTYNYRVGASPVAALVIPGVFLCSIRMTSGGRDVINVVGVQKGGGTAVAAATAVDAGWRASGGPLSKLPTVLSYTGVIAMDLSSANGDIYNLAVSPVSGGSGISQIATNAACALVKWNGGTRSGSSRGRMYFGPLDEGAVNNDGRTILASSITATNAAMTQFRTGLATAGYPLVVVSRKYSSATVVTSNAVESVIATQRRRIRS